MALHEKTADELRNEYIQKMGQELGDCFWLLSNELTLLHMRWIVYRQLYAKSPARIDLMNDTAPAFFRCVQDALFDDAILSISRLTDPHKTGKNNNLTLSRLCHLIKDGVLGRKLQDMLNQIGDKCSSIRHIRNRSIAHQDLASAHAVYSDESISLSRDCIEKALSEIRDFMNEILIKYRFPPAAYERPMPGYGDGDTLIMYVQLGHEYYEKQKKGMISGEFSPKDWIDRKYV